MRTFSSSKCRLNFSDLSTGSGEVTSGERDFCHFVFKKKKKKQGKDCLVMIDNQGNYLEQLRIMLPRLMCFLEFRRVFCARCYISRASGWILKI